MNLPSGDLGATKSFPHTTQLDFPAHWGQHGHAGVAVEDFGIVVVVVVLVLILLILLVVAAVLRRLNFSPLFFPRLFLLFVVLRLQLLGGFDIGGRVIVIVALAN